MVDVFAEFSYPHAYEAGIGYLEDCARPVMQSDIVRVATEPSTLEILSLTVTPDRAIGSCPAPNNLFDSVLNESKLLPGLSKIDNDIRHVVAPLEDAPCTNWSSRCDSSFWKKIPWEDMSANAMVSTSNMGSMSKSRQDSCENNDMLFRFWCRGVGTSRLLFRTQYCLLGLDPKSMQIKDTVGLIAGAHAEISIQDRK